MLSENKSSNNGAPRSRQNSAIMMTTMAIIYSNPNRKTMERLDQNKEIRTAERARIVTAENKWLL